MTKLPDYYARCSLNPDDYERLEAGTHRVTRMVEREDKRLQLVVSPVLCYRENLPIPPDHACIKFECLTDKAIARQGIDELIFAHNKEKNDA